MNFSKKTYFVVSIFLVLCFFLFQNCSAIHLTAPSSPQQITQEPSPTPSPTPQTITMQPGFTSTSTPTSTDGGCAMTLNAPNWWIGIRNLVGNGAIPCSLGAGASQYYSYHFTVPSVATMQTRFDATMGNIVLGSNKFFAISNQDPSSGSFPVGTNCTNNKMSFINWGVDGLNPALQGRSDYCVLEPGQTYWVIVAQANAVDASASTQQCDGDNGQTCWYTVKLNWDAIFVNEGYDSPSTCQYQVNDPVFQTTTMVGQQGSIGTGAGVIAASANVSPEIYGFRSAMLVMYPLHPDYSPDNFSLDVGVLNPAYHGNPAQSIVALKFKTPKFGEGSGYIAFHHNGDLSSVGYGGVGATHISFSDCPGSFPSQVSNNWLLLDGFNLLQVNGHYRNQDVYAMGMTAGNQPTGVWQTTSPSPQHVLRPQTDYFWNITTPANGCPAGVQQVQGKYCATGRSTSTNEDMGSPLYINSEQQ